MWNARHSRPHSASQTLSPSPSCTICLYFHTVHAPVISGSFLFNDCKTARSCFAKTAISISLTLLLDCYCQCHCHSFTVHLLSPWTNSNRSCTASALSCITVTAVLPYTRYPLPRWYRIFLRCPHYCGKNAVTVTVSCLGLLETASKFALFLVSGLKDEKLTKKANLHKNWNMQTLF